MGDAYMAKAVKSIPEKGVKKVSKPAAKKKPVVLAKKKPAAARKPAARTVAPPVKKKAGVKKAVKVTPKRSAKKPAGKKASKDMTRYRCKLCGYIYSPLRGEPHNGIPEGTAFDDLPEDYVCPVCGMQGKGRIGKWGFDAWRPTRYLCSMCSYVYDEKRGEPHRGIKPGTKFEDLPEDYVCPVCALDPKIRVQFGKVFKQGFEPLNV
ncbi:MAG: rubredoxin [Methanoregula sp.]|jgi:rubredoxin|uniref:rubredoxin n=1 Tax=Methanoregula sp. TaxID=2052170 RepID=UPI0025F5EF6F|nr:rubredoxin [Methanoregula sp.]MCK9631436.1 rubredoxin [Methanoregula sp.]